jgi:starvation-inducible DNA-binding protein
MTAPARKPRRAAALAMARAAPPRATRDLCAALNALLADAFAMYLKAKSFHWHATGPHARDHHLLFDAQAAELLAMTDPLAERVRKLGGGTLRSIGHVARLQRVIDSDSEHATAAEMLRELCEDNRQLAERLRAAHGLCGEHGDVASAGLLAVWIDQAEGRAWMLAEMQRG